MDNEETITERAQRTLRAALHDQARRLRNTAASRTYGGQRNKALRAQLRDEANSCDAMAKMLDTDPARLAAILGMLP